MGYFATKYGTETTPTESTTPATSGGGYFAKKYGTGEEIPQPQTTQAIATSVVAPTVQKKGIWGWLSKLLLPKAKKGALVAPMTGGGMTPQQTEVAQTIIRKPTGVEKISGQNNPAEFIKGATNPLLYVQMPLNFIERGLLQAIPKEKRDAIRADPLFQRSMKLFTGTDEPQTFSEQYGAAQQEYGKGLGTVVGAGQTIMEVASFLPFLQLFRMKIPKGKIVTEAEVKKGLVDSGVPKEEVAKLKFKETPEAETPAVKPTKAVPPEDLMIRREHTQDGVTPTQDVLVQKSTGETLTTIKTATEKNTYLTEGYKPEAVAEAPKPLVRKPPEPATDLLTKARKYKSAEEFVRGQGETVYHGTSGENATKINSEGFKVGSGKGVSGQTSNDFIYATENRASAGKYVSDRLGIKNPTTVNGSFNGKVLDIQGKMADFEALGEASKKLGVPLGVDSQGKLSMLDMPAIKKAMQEQGYSAIRFSDRYANGSKALAILPENIKTKSQLTSIWEEANKTKPVLAPSKIAKSVEAKAVEAKLTKGFSEVAGYEKMNIKEQATRATEAVNTDLEGTRAIIRGEKPLPEGLRGTALITAMEEHIKANPSADLAYELANSRLISETSAAAQELRLAAERTPDSATAKIIEVKKAREAKVKDFEQKRSTETKSVKKETTKLNLSKEELSFNRFLDNITC